jgi:hypothetical protein
MVGLATHGRGLVAAQTPLRSVGTGVRCYGRKNLNRSWNWRISIWWRDRTLASELTWSRLLG